MSGVRQMLAGPARMAVAALSAFLLAACAGVIALCAAPMQAFAADGVYAFICQGEDDAEGEYTLVIKNGTALPDEDVYGAVVKDWSSDGETDVIGRTIGEEGNGVPCDISNTTRVRQEGGIRLDTSLTDYDYDQSQNLYWYYIDGVYGGLAYPWRVDDAYREHIVRVKVIADEDGKLVAFGNNSLFAGLTACKEFDLSGLQSSGGGYMFGIYDYNVRFYASYSSWNKGNGTSFYTYPSGYDTWAAASYVHNNKVYWSESPYNAPCTSIEKIVTGPGWTGTKFSGLYSLAMYYDFTNYAATKTYINRTWDDDDPQKINRAYATTLWTVARNGQVVERTTATKRAAKTNEYGSITVNLLPSGAHVYYTSKEACEANKEQDYKTCYGDADPTSFKDSFSFTAQPSDWAVMANASTAPSLTAAATAERADGMPTSGSVTYKWFKSSSISGAGATQVSTAQSYNAPNNASAVGATYYYCQATNPETGATANSNVVCVRVFDAADGPRFNKASQSPNTDPDFPAQYLTREKAQALHVTLDDAGWFTSKYSCDAPTASYQWYMAGMDGEYSAVEGANAASYVPSTNMAAGVYSYYCVATYAVDTYSRGAQQVAFSSTSDTFYVEIDEPGAYAGQPVISNVDMDSRQLEAPLESIDDLAVSVSVPHGNAGVMTYQWFASADGTIAEDDDPLTEALAVPEDGVISYAPAKLPGEYFYYVKVSNRVYTDQGPDKEQAQATSDVAHIGISGIAHVATAQDLLKIRNNPADYDGFTIYIDADIDLTADEETAAWESALFYVTNATIEGQGHAITVSASTARQTIEAGNGTPGVSFLGAGTYNVTSGALFGSLENCTLRNLSVRSMGNLSAGLAVVIANSTVENVVTYGSVGGVSSANAAGFANYIAGSTVKNCGNEASVSGVTEKGGWPADSFSAYGFAAGILGKSTVSGCYNAGEVTGGYAYGFAGYTYAFSYNTLSSTATTHCFNYDLGDLTIENCYNSGTAQGRSSAYGLICLDDRTISGTTEYLSPYNGKYSTEFTHLKNLVNFGTVKSDNATYPDGGCATIRVYNGSVSAAHVTDYSLASSLYYLADRDMTDEASASPGNYCDQYATKMTTAEMSGADFLATLNGTLEEGQAGAWKAGAITPVLAWQTASTAAAPLVADQEETLLTTEKDVPFQPIAITATLDEALGAAYKGALTYQWYKADAEDGEGAAIADATAASYTPACDTAGWAYYYCVATNTFAGGSESTRSGVYSALVRSGVEPATPIIAAQPQSGTFGYQAQPTASVEAGFAEGETLGQGEISYQWYQAAADATEFDPDTDTALAGCTGETYAGDAVTAASSYQVYCVATNTYELRQASVQSEPALITCAMEAYVYTPADLLAIASYCNAGKYSNPYAGVTVKLMNDIDLSTDPDTAVWPGIGWIDNWTGSFYGSFDGQGHTISGFYMNCEGTNSQNNIKYLGLFGAVGSAGTICNFTLVGSIDATDCPISNYCYVGGVCGITASSRKTFQNITVDVDITAAGNALYVGGAIGYHYPSSSGAQLNNISSYGDITVTGATHYGVGGIAGTIVGTKNIVVSDCYNRGNITADQLADNASGIGGIAGTVSSPITVSDVYNAGAVKVLGGSYVGTDYQGPIFGRVTADAATVEGAYYLEGVSTYTDAEGATRPANGYYKGGETVPYVAKTAAELASADMVATLNGELAEGEAGAWKAGNLAYPLLAFEAGDRAAAITIEEQPQGAVYELGQTVEPLTVVAKGSGLSYQWYSSASATTEGATPLAGATSSSFTPALASAGGTAYYYCVVSNPINSVASDFAEIIVPDAVAAATPVITAQPQSAEYQTLSEASALTVAAGFAEGEALGKGVLTYQWYKLAGEAPDTERDTLLEGATEASYVPSTRATGSYYCVVANTYQVKKSAHAVSDVAVVTCTDEIVNITTVEEFLAFRDSVNAGNTYEGKTVEVAAGTYNLGAWKASVGNAVATPFSGTFHGNGSTFVLAGIGEDYMAKTISTARPGLFGMVKGGTLSGFTVKGEAGCYQTMLAGADYMGGLVCSYLDNGTIDNVSAYGTLVVQCNNVSNTTGAYTATALAGAGAIAGFAADSSISNVTADVVVIGGEDRDGSDGGRNGNAGGIVGAMAGGSITGATASGEVYAPRGNAGGIVGYASSWNGDYDTPVISECVSSAAVRTGYGLNTGSYASNVNSRAYFGGAAGGIVAHADDVKVASCANKGEVRGWLASGGIVGYAVTAGFRAEAVYNTGSVSVIDTQKDGVAPYSGGLAGFLAEGSAISDAYSTGAVDSISASGIGALSGSAASTQLVNCYFAASAYPTDPSGITYDGMEKLESEDFVAELNPLDEEGKEIQLFAFNPMGTPTLAFETPHYLSDGGVSLEEGTFAYNGSAVEPSVTVLYRGVALEQGVDFAVTYENNTGVGTATATIEGIGDYTGTFTREFQIVAGKLTITVASAQKYLGEADPELTYAVEGLAESDSIISAKVKRVAGESVGAYAITVEDVVVASGKSIVTDSYDIAVVPGELTIMANQPDAPTGLKGDVNGNGTVNIVDAQIAYDIAVNFAYLTDEWKAMIPRADVTGDGFVAAEDALAIQYASIHGWPAD